MTSQQKLIILHILLILTMTLAGCAAQAAGYYTVKSGDTLALIAANQETTVEALVELNQGQYPSLKTDPGLIEVGWKLKLPGSAGISVSNPLEGVKEILTPPPQPIVVTMTREAFELEVVRLVNEERAQAGLPALTADPTLMEIARARSEDMVARGYFGHYDPETGEILPHKLAGAAENITKLSRASKLTDRNAARAVRNWMNSEAHRQNMLDERAPHTCTGLGIAFAQDGVIITQLFKK